MRRVGGTFNGTGADVYLCIGFVPDWVRVWNLEGTCRILLEWNWLMMRSGELVEGIQITGADAAAAALTKGNGLLPFNGGTVLTATTAGTTTYGEGVYLKWDHNDYRYTDANAPSGIGDASSADITKWTLGSATNYTGNFDNGADEDYIGEGSIIIIDGKKYSIVGFTSDGSAANDVTLSHPAKSGDIQFIGGMYSTKPMVAGEVTKEGFLVSNATVNVDGQMCAFEAGKYDN